MENEIKDSSGNVFSDLGLEDAEDLSQKAALAIQIATVKMSSLSEGNPLTPADAQTPSVGSGCATGRELFSRLARSGPALDVTSPGLSPRHQPRLSMKSVQSDP